MSTFDRTFDVARRLLAGETLICGKYSAQGQSITRRGTAGPERLQYQDVYEAARVFVDLVRASCK